jgi:UDP-glucose 4-epimerase
MEEEMEILVTGGLGVNGAWVARKLVERGHRPVILENRIDTSLMGEELLREVDIVEADILNLERLKLIFSERKIQRVVHMAALITGLQENPLKGFEVNALGTVNVLEAATTTGVERVVYTSSRAAYGVFDGVHGHPTYVPMKEDQPVRPYLVYDICKIASEVMGQNYARMRGLQFVSLRFAQIYGPGKLQRHGTYGIFSQLVEGPLAGRSVKIPRGGDQQDDIIYVDDIAEAIVLATLHPRPAYDLYNISRGVGTTLHDFADAVRKVVPNAQIEIGGGLDYHGLGVSRSGLMDNSRARADLGFEPQFDLDRGVAHYVETLTRLKISPPAALIAGR